MKKLIPVLICLLCGALWAQSAPQVTVNLNFLTGGPYAQASAVDATFGTQFTTNGALHGDFITMPAASYTGYFGGYHYDVAAACPLLATTTFSCGKFIPFVEGEAGLGRIQAGTNPSVQSPAFLVRAGADYDPSGAGHYAVIFQGGYGKFGPAIAGQSDSGFFFQTGISFGMGSNAAASLAKQQRMAKAQAKKQAKLAKQAAKKG